MDNTATESFPEFSSSSIYILPLGGCGEFGKNLTAYVIDKKLFIVDYGIMFAEPFRLGVDASFVKIDFLLEKFKQVKAYLITHGHEDHLGAVAHALKQFPAPVFATEWTLELIKDKLARINLNSASFALNPVKPGDTVQFGPIKIQWIGVNHSIPMCCALHIKAHNLTIFHTGDFKCDPSTTFEPPIDLGLLKKLGENRISLLCADSTNAHKTGRCPSEDSVFEALQEVFSQLKARIYLTTFSSNLWRILTVMRLAKKFGRQVYLAGAGLKKTTEIAYRLNMLSGLNDVLIGDDKLSSLSPNQLCVLATGCQAEPYSAMARILRDEFSGLRLDAGDGVIFSSRIIPGNERAIQTLMSECVRKKAKLFTTNTHPNIHVSGHGYQEDLKDLFRLLRPRNFLAVHGSYFHLNSNNDLARTFGSNIPDETALNHNGILYELDQSQSLKPVTTFKPEISYIDGFSKLELSPKTLRQRLKIGEYGAAFLTGVYEVKKKRWTKEPQFELIGLELPASLDYELWYGYGCREITTACEREMSDCDEQKLNETARLSLRYYLSQTFNKKVVVIAKIHVY